MRPTVILRACPDYDVERIERLAFEGLETLGLTPHGRVLCKPNVVASGKHFPHAHTRAEFMEGVLKALRRKGQGITELAVGERCGITMPTRFAYRGAGYYAMARRVGGVTLHHFDEVAQVEIPMYHPERLRDSLFTPEPVATADFFVNCPKFKAHPWTTVTFSMKNYIGIQDDRHRLIDHDHRLNEKVADLQYIVQPQFIAIDGIIAGEGRMLTPIPFDLKLMIMGNNQVAFDAVCCHIIGIDPLSVDHIRMAHERGFGPVDLKHIDVVGDVSLEEAKERAAGFRSGLIRVEDYFQGTNIHAYSGPPPSDGGHDYCWGGCPGALEEAIEILRIFDSATDTKMPPTHIVFGKYDGRIDANPGETVVFIGDCAQFDGRIAEQDVVIENLYVDRSRHDPLQAKGTDIFAKMLKVGIDMRQAKVAKDVIRLKGCPVSVAEHVLALVSLGKLKNPYYEPSNAVLFTSAYMSMRTRQAINKLRGQPYNRPGPLLRGEARPRLNLPAPGQDAPLERR
ncbi:MAG: DUF362 domain-containing protein [Myxococcales bacterium]|nr:DUF362 domain-containing protein [Myxococcales bacterium]